MRRKGPSSIGNSGQEVWQNWRGRGIIVASTTKAPRYGDDEGKSLPGEWAPGSGSDIVAQGGRLVKGGYFGCSAFLCRNSYFEIIADICEEEFECP